MPKQIIFVSAFGSIYRQVLPLIDEVKNKGEVLIIAPEKDYYKLFKKYTDLNVVCMNVNPTLITKKTWYLVLFNALRSKIEYRRLFKNTKNCDIYFFCTSHKIVMLSYIQKLSKHNHVHFYSFIEDKLENQIKPTILKDWKSFFIRFSIKILLGLSVVIRNDCGMWVVSVYRPFFEKNNIEMNYKEFDPKIYLNYIKETPEIQDKKVLVLVTDLVDEKRMDESEFEESMNKLVTILEKTYPNEYVIKPHPVRKKLYGKMKDSPVLDYFVPSQFLFKHHWKVLIGICTSSVFFPDCDFLKDTKQIELLDLLKLKDEKTKTEIKQFLLNWNKNLLYPKTFYELEKMIC